jgi:hypothetical protein
MPESLPNSLRLKLISCEVMYREFCHVVAESPHTVDIEFVAKGLHDLGAEPMRKRLQSVIDLVPADTYDAILLGYGLCNNGLTGVTARHTKLVLPRAHDCITLFLGSKERYMEYFDSHPGVYFKTTGWIERGNVSDELLPQSVQHQVGMDRTYQELVEKYGEDNAQYLYAMLCDTLHNYSQFTFIEMGIEPDDRFERQTATEAQEKGWTYEKVRGDMRLFRKLVNGEWDPEEFLIVNPGQRIVAPLDAGIVTAVEA